MESQHRSGLPRDHPSHDASAVWKRARDGDDSAVGALVAMLSPAIESWLRASFRGDADRASGALQDAWMSAVASLDIFQSVEHLQAWLRRVARNRAISGLRKTRRFQSPPTDEDGFGLLVQIRARIAPATDRELYAQLQSGIARIPDAYRGAATLFYVHGQPLGEVAVLLGLPKSTVKMRLHRARERLRRTLRRTPPS